MKTYWMIIVTLLFFNLGTAQNEAPDLGVAAFGQKVDALVKQYQDLDIFSGVVLVAKEGEPVYHKAFGLADRSKNIPNTLTTKFDIGSMNKTFTKVVILRLAEQGKLKLTDKLTDILPGFPSEADQVTVEHLLSHRSGYGDYITPEYFDLPLSEKTIGRLTERIKKLPLMFPPGEGRAYSNAGYILLGAIIEKITGQSYYQVVDEMIVKPLGLANTYLKNKDAVPDRSIGYLKNMKGELESNEHLEKIPTSAGGFLSTTTDILKFYRAFFYGDQLLKPATRELDEFYNFLKEHLTSGAAIPIAGGFNGANTVIFEILRDRISIVVFANMDEPVAEQLGEGILAIIRGQDPREPALPAIQRVYASFKEHGASYVKEHFGTLTSNFHPDDPKDLILNQIGYNLLFDGKVEEAIEVFTLNTELFPDIANCYDSLGEAYLKKGDRAKALELYKKALSINPDIPSAQKMVRDLQKG